MLLFMCRHHIISGVFSSSILGCFSCYCSGSISCYCTGSDCFSSSSPSSSSSGPPPPSPAPSLRSLHLRCLLQLHLGLLLLLLLRFHLLLMHRPFPGREAGFCLDSAYEPDAAVASAARNAPARAAPRAGGARARESEARPPQRRGATVVVVFVVTITKVFSRAILSAPPRIYNTFLPPKSFLFFTSLHPFIFMWCVQLVLQIGDSGSRGTA